LSLLLLHDEPHPFDVVCYLLMRKYTPPWSLEHEVDKASGLVGSESQSATNGEASV
jgi:hypothetical protein